MEHLDARLGTIAAMVPRCRAVADIGCDHGLLVAALLEGGRCDYGIAADINPMPLEKELSPQAEKARQELTRRGLLAQSECRLTNGLCGIAPVGVDAVVIAGMGGELIADILSRWDYTENPAITYLLQPMTRPVHLRRWLYTHRFTLWEERCCRANGKLYTVLRAQYTGCATEETPAALYFGALDLENDPLAGEYREQVLVDGNIVLAGPGEPLGAFVAAYVAIEIGILVTGRTKLDIILTPLICIGVGAVVGLFVGPPISSFMNWLGSLINWGTEQQPFLMGIVVSVLMGMILTLPISSAALGVILNLSGLAAGAATVGCCCNMIGFAVASYRENKIGGFLAQGIGTSMLQVPNIMRHPLIWIPSILSSAILGPVSTMLLHMTNNATGSGMGTAGLVGPLMTWQVMIQTEDPMIVLVKIIVIQFVLPALITLGISEFMRKKGWIRQGDMKLEL